MTTLKGVAARAIRQAEADEVFRSAPSGRRSQQTEESSMPHEVIPLPEVDELRLSIVVDNSVDVLMAGTEVAHRLPRRVDAFERPAPRAEHGFSVLLEARRGQTPARLLFDTGVTRDGILHNFDVMEIDARDIQAIVLSHGHADHTLGLPG